MLAFLLFNAGLGIKLQEIKHLASTPALPLLGFLANSLVPISLIFLLRDLMGVWHNQDELQNLLAGLALIVRDANRRLVNRLVAERQRQPIAKPRTCSFIYYLQPFFDTR